MSRGELAIIALFFEFLGVHLFAVGKIETGILWMLSMGLFGFCVTIDFILFLAGSFKNSQGQIV